MLKVLACPPPVLYMYRARMLLPELREARPSDVLSDSFLVAAITYT